MEDSTPVWYDAGAPAPERPSEDFIRAVAELLETDAEDMLVELGYVYPEAVVGVEAGPVKA